MIVLPPLDGELSAQLVRLLGRRIQHLRDGAMLDAHEFTSRAREIVFGHAQRLLARDAAIELALQVTVYAASPITVRTHTDRRSRPDHPVPLLDTLKDVWAREAPFYVVHDVPAAAVQPAGDTGAPCQAGTHYFRLWLAEMRLAQDQTWFTTRHPAVHSLVRLRFGDEDVELPRLSGPMTLPGLDQAHLGAVVHLDHPLTPLLPYNGGIVELSAGLVALEGTRVLGEFVKAIDAVTQVLVQPPLSSAVAAVGPVTRAVQTLFGAGAGRQHLGVHLAYAGDQAPRHCTPATWP